MKTDRDKLKAWLYWYDINEAKDLLEDGEKYLILHKDYKYPLVARYKIANLSLSNLCRDSKPHFIFNNFFGEVCTHLSDNKITHFALLLSRDEYLECIDLCNRQGDTIEKQEPAKKTKAKEEAK